MLTYRWFAKTYGFRPRDVDELPVEALTWFPVIEEAESEAQDRLSRQEMQHTRGRR